MTTQGAPLAPPRRRRRNPLPYALALALLVAGGGYMLFSSLGNNLVYFLTPLEYQEKAAQFQNRTLRLGGLVQNAEYDAKSQALHFTITDGTASYPVKYQGAVTALFKNNNGVVVEGKMENGTFQASNLLVKHSEEYAAPKSQADIKRLLQNTKLEDTK
ncbi:cytochrome c maturation protein CcmE [Deinococcus yavapaiensis]|uniref:Cytochrome c-type biogenesis protein CcmE n=1 Tax=Deinococcus yavapaiensis KR-236 TaxID=694435 RepID=A0A318SBX0_9DEIO|nr:cytochrome c maturation protein CcmE [Deinococcus yavapaiensis]PYE55874.1 cytochrome c-type biogenesis protein CcmE [Deinococcus yavapaiensis KR-236]